MGLKTARGRLFFLLMLIVSFPFLQHCLSFIESGKVNGAVVTVADSTFTWARWWAGDYQRHKNLYLNDNCGARPDLVRLNNEFDYRVFNKLHANGVVIGKDECLYEKFYIDEYNGLDFMGNEVIKGEIIKMKKIQDTLEHLGKTFVFMYAPSKAWYFPDKFPPSLEKKTHGPTNYKTFKRIGDSVGLHQLDFNSWFLAMKDTSKHLLFSPLGTHWTVYGSLLASDSVIKYIERVRNIKMPELKWNEVVFNDTPRRTDNDLSAGLNLVTHFRRQRFSYPNYFYKEDSRQTKPKAIYIGDSFLWTWTNNRLMHNTNADWAVWYYFNEAWTDKALSGIDPMRYLDNFKWQDDMLNTDCIIVLYTPANFKGFNYDGSFVERIYSYFYPAQ